MRDYIRLARAIAGARVEAAKARSLDIVEQIKQLTIRLQSSEAEVRAARAALAELDELEDAACPSSE